ncbi:unnamed protein product [Urochloa humidicola]
MEEPIIAGPQTVPHDTSGGSSNTFPFERKKFVVGAIESSSPQTPEEHLSSLKELLDTLLEESVAASPRTVPHDTSSSPTPASALGSTILSRSPPNWYEVFYIRMDHGGSFHMYPDLGGPFLCIDEANIAINRYLDELRRGSGCKEQGNLNIVDRMVHNCKYYLDGTPRRGLNSPSNKTYDEKRYLVQALLDQHSDAHNLFGHLELEDILMRQCIYEDHRWFYHFNFTTKKRESDDNPSAGRLFFAEVSHIQGEDAWEVNCCCMIEAEDNGWCYVCRNNGSTGMKHPKSTDAYTGGHLNGYLPFDCVESSSSEDEEYEDTRLRHMFEGLDDPHAWDYLFPSSRSVDVEDIDY